MVFFDVKRMFDDIEIVARTLLKNGLNAVPDKLPQAVVDEKSNLW